MVGSRVGGVKAKRVLIALLVCAATASGCWWRSYPARMRTHTELLVAFARKGRDLVATGRFTAESLPELTYPLERADAFGAEATRRVSPPPASLVAFDTLLARYRTFVELLDDTRRTKRGPAGAEELAQPLADVEAAAAEVRAALDREAGGSGAR
jgi:hypothetical protein